MIKNERQYRITRGQVGTFVRALEQLMQEPPDEASRVHLMLLKAQKAALRSQLSDLREQLKEHEALRFDAAGTAALPGQATEDMV